MGRGENGVSEINEIPARSQSDRPVSASVGQRWRRIDDPEVTLEIVHITPEWSHVSVVVRASNAYAVQIYSSRKLADEWRPIEEYSKSSDSAELFSLIPPPPRDDIPESVMLGGDRAWKAILAREAAREGKTADQIEEMTPRQSGYLKSLCKKHGREFDPSLSKKEASALISELKGLPDPVTEPKKRDSSRQKPVKTAQPELV